MDLTYLPFHMMLPPQLSKGVPSLQAQSNFKVKQPAGLSRLFPSFWIGEKIAFALGMIFVLGELGLGVTIGFWGKDFGWGAGWVL